MRRAWATAALVVTLATGPVAVQATEASDCLELGCLLVLLAWVVPGVLAAAVAWGMAATRPSDLWAAALAGVALCLLTWTWSAMHDWDPLWSVGGPQQLAAVTALMGAGAGATFAIRAGWVHWRTSHSASP